VGVPTINRTVSTLRFFFRGTLKRHEIIEHTHVIHEPRKLPVVVLSPDENFVAERECDENVPAWSERQNRKLGH
jgi:hypothetical protein